MKTGKADRRVRYTMRSLRDGLIELMQENHISKISVKMLCEHADINRSTFYAHYENQYDLLRRLEQEVIADFNESIDRCLEDQPVGDTVSLMRQLLDYAAKNAELVMVLLSENGESEFQKDLVSIAQQRLILYLREDTRLTSHLSEYLQGFVISGAVNILHKWIQDGMVESTQEMAELISRLLFSGLSSFLRNGGPGDGGTD